MPAMDAELGRLPDRLVGFDGLPQRFALHIRWELDLEELFDGKDIKSVKKGNSRSFPFFLLNTDQTIHQSVFHITLRDPPSPLTEHDASIEFRLSFKQKNTALTPGACCCVSGSPVNIRYQFRLI